MKFIFDANGTDHISVKQLVSASFPTWPMTIVTGQFIVVLTYLLRFPFTMFAMDMTNSLLCIFAHFRAKFIEYCKMVLFNLVVFFLFPVCFWVKRLGIMCLQVFPYSFHLGLMAFRMQELPYKWM